MLHQEVQLPSTVCLICGRRMSVFVDCGHYMFLVLEGWATKWLSALSSAIRSHESSNASGRGSGILDVAVAATKERVDLRESWLSSRLLLLLSNPGFVSSISLPSSFGDLAINLQLPFGAFWATNMKIGTISDGKYYLVRGKQHKV